MITFGCGPFTCQSQKLHPESGQLQRHLVDLAGSVEAEKLDSIWLSEHHFTADGYTSSLFPLLGAMAAVTERIALGTKVVLAPLIHPLRLAEDAAQVASLSDGRLVLGLGLGYSKQEFQALGVSLSERGARMDESITVLRKAWTGQPFDHEGPTVVANGVVCRPAPPKPPEIWIGGSANKAIYRAATRADGYLPSGGAGPNVKAQVEALDDATPGNRGPLPLVTSLMAGLVTSESERDEVDRGVKQVLKGYVELMKKSGVKFPGRAGLGPEDTYAVVGGPEEVAATAIRIVRSFPGRDQHFVVRLDFPGMGHEDVRRKIQTYAREVVPLIREACA